MSLRDMITGWENKQKEKIIKLAKVRPTLVMDLAQRLCKEARSSQIMGEPCYVIPARFVDQLRVAIDCTKEVVEVTEQKTDLEEHVEAHTQCDLFESYDPGKVGPEPDCEGQNYYMCEKCARRIDP